MKTTIILFVGISFLIFFINCSQTKAPDNQQATIDSLQHIVELLKPGLGEFMIQLEYHHTKLAKTIAEKKYDQVSYEVDEIKEVAEKIEKLHITNDKLTGPFANFYEKYLKSPLDILADAAAKKNDQALQTNYIALTNNCNSCHHENNMSFMKIEP